MRKLKSILGHGWALLAVPILLATFIGMNFWAGTLATSTGVIVSPWFTGGEVARTIPHDGYTTAVHRPIFRGLIGERAEGFVQVRWKPDKGKTLPAQIDEAIDLDGSGTPDFRVQLDTGACQAVVIPQSARVLGLSEVINLGQDRAVRVLLRNTRRP